MALKRNSISRILSCCLGAYLLSDKVAVFIFRYSSLFRYGVSCSYFMTAISTWVFVRVHNWKSRLLIVHSAGLIYSHWQTRNIDSQKYQCSYKAIYSCLYKRDSYGKAIMHCTKGDINLKFTKNEHCIHTLKWSTSCFPWSGCKEWNACHLSALSNS